MLKRFFSRRKSQELEVVHDVAHEDWAPIPASQADVDWGQWLQQEELPKEPPPTKPKEIKAKEKIVSIGRARIRTPPPTERRWQDVIQTCAEYLTDEELRIILKQMAH
jgi:hypothetical protein